MVEQIQHLRVTYNDIHNLIRKSASKIKQFNPDLLIAIGGGGFFPARVMRTFLRAETNNKALQIQAIGLSLYEPVEGLTVDKIGNEVIRTQWLSDPGKLLLGKRILIVDEVDDSRKTLQYAILELKKDLETELLSYPDESRESLRRATHFAVFVVHNKLKPKLAELPAGTRYFSGAEVGNLWVDYPWEAMDIEDHDFQAALDKEK